MRTPTHTAFNPAVFYLALRYRKHFHHGHSQSFLSKRRHLDDSCLGMRSRTSLGRLRLRLRETIPNPLRLRVKCLGGWALAPSPGKMCRLRWLRLRLRIPGLIPKHKPSINTTPTYIFFAYRSQTSLSHVYRIKTE